jgi:hypothetical protein
MKIVRAAWAFALLPLLVSAALAACGRSPRKTAAHARAMTETAPSTPRPSIGHPRARWRLVSFEELNRVALWVSHIVVMHANSNPSATVLRRSGWNPDPPMPNRSLEEALTRALNVAELAAKNPEKFEELAHRYSDDVVTAAEGGSFGGIRAGQLPPEYVDALAATRPGSVSRVFQTVAGFHIIKRRAVPPDEKLAGQRLVIRYRGTFGGEKNVPSTRTRAEALDLARDLAQEARAGQKTFDDLVRQYSDGFDVAVLGDLGVRSAQDPGVWSREFERLASLRVGEIAEPIDSLIGFEVLLRKPVPAQSTAKPEPPARYELPDPAAPDYEAIVRHTDSATLAQAAREFAGEARATLRMDPESLGEIEHGWQSLASAFEKNSDQPAARVASWRATRSELRSTLGPDRFAEYEQFLNAWTAKTIIARTL